MDQNPLVNNQSDDLGQLAKAKQAAADFGLELIRLDEKAIQVEALAKISKKLAQEYQLIPIKIEEKALTLAVADTSLLTQKAPDFLQDLKTGGFNLNVKIITPNDFNRAIKAYDRKPAVHERSILPQSSPAPAIFKEVITSQPSSRGIDTVDLEVIKIPKVVLDRFPQDVAKRYKIVVFAVSPDEKEVSVAALNPEDQRVKDILGFVEKRNKTKVKLYQATLPGINKALEGYELAKTQEEIEQKPVLVSEQVEVPLEAEKPLPVSTQSVEPIKVESEPAPSIDQNKVELAITQEQSQTTTSNQAAPQIAIGEIIQTVADQEAATTITPVNVGQEEDDLGKMLGGPVDSEAVLEKHIKSGIIPKSVAAILAYAVNLGASDVHIEGQEKNLRVRYRIDGLLRDVVGLPSQLLAPIVSRIKILSRLKIDETRLPQDGRFGVIVEGRGIDLRVSTLPTTQGEKVVMRILDKTTGLKKVTELGLLGINLMRVTESLQNPYGIIFVTGPTGSGKTTTLYAILNDLNKVEVNITTLEDPVEYQLVGINQTQIKAKIGYSFADGLRSIVRQDPDIIMVGEVRDSETATLATQAALTGHLVLSTLHTNDAAGAIPRLIDMEVEPFLLSSSINIIVAQRLVRKLCSVCKVEADIPSQTVTVLKNDLDQIKDPDFKKVTSQPLKFFSAKGCGECNKGYKGRIGIFEVFKMSDQISKLTIAKAASSDIEAQALKEGMIKMRQDGIVKALQGLTSLDEVLRVTAK